MNILAIDTMGLKASVTLDKNGILTDKSVDNKITHSEKLLPLIDECLKEADLKILDIDTFCITTGPGSFTGIRIGIATIKAFAKISNAKIFGVNTLECLAYEVIEKKIASDYLLSLLDAKNDRVYYALYKLENNILIPVISPSNDIISDAINITKDYLDTLNKDKNDKVSIAIISDIENMNKYISNLDPNIISEFITSSVSTNTLIKMAKEYILNNNLNNKYNFNYATLDATYARPSQAERIKNGEKI